MAKKYFPYLAPFLVMIAFFLDGQLSTLAFHVTPAHVFISSHLLLILGLFCAMHLPMWYSLLLFAAIGAVHDVYYVRVLGLATTFLPLAIFLMYYFYQSVRFRFVTNLMVVTVAIFVLECANFLLARLFGLTNLSLFIFVFNGLLPTMLFNSVLLFVVSPVMKAVFGITNKT